jgi:hypothetical protein
MISLKKKLTPVTIVYAVALVAFFILNQYTFWFSDDYSMGYSERYGGQISSVHTALSASKDFYFGWGGAFSIAFFQYLFCGVIQNKLIFNIINTAVFGLLLLFGAKISNTDHTQKFGALLFLILFWFCCPAPNETLFWVVGSIGYLWSNACAMFFLFIYLKYKDTNSPPSAKILLFVVSILTAWTGIIATASICGSFVVCYLYYAYKGGLKYANKILENNALPLVIGFFTGAAFLIFAPGNYVRQGIMYASFADAKAITIYCINSCLLTFCSYKAVYIATAALLVLFLKNRTEFRNFVSGNKILLLSLAWSVIAFSFVFRAATRAAFFPETLSCIIIAKLGCKYLSTRKLEIVCAIGLILFCADYSVALTNAKKQYANNQTVIAEMIENKGDVCFETVPNKHRMVLPLRFDSWCAYGLCQKYSLPHIIFRPLLHCQTSYVVNACNDDNRHSEINNHAFSVGNKIVLKIPSSAIASKGLNCHINYILPTRWHRTLREKVGLFSYHHTTNQTLFPDFSNNGFSYYFVPALEWNNEEIITSIQTDL